MPVYLHLNHLQVQSWRVLQFHVSFPGHLLNYLGLVDQGGMGANHSGARPGFGSECAIRLLIARTVSFRHLGAVGLAVLVIGMLLAGGTPQTFIHFILIICYWRVVAAQRRVLRVTFGDTSWSRTPLCWENGAAV